MKKKENPLSFLRLISLLSPPPSPPTFFPLSIYFSIQRKGKEKKERNGDKRNKKKERKKKAKINEEEKKEGRERDKEKGQKNVYEGKNSVLPIIDSGKKF